MRSLAHGTAAAALSLFLLHCGSSSTNGGSDPIPPSMYMGAGGGGPGTSGAGGAGAGPMGLGIGGTSSFGGDPTGGGGSAGGSVKLEVSIRTIAPVDTDPKIDQYLEPHAVLLRDPLPTAKVPLLYLHLGKTGSLPLDAKMYLTQAAFAGYYVVDLRYPNAVSVAAACDADADAACSQKIRAELFDGSDASKKVSVSPANGILNRLTRLLATLVAKYPNEGWGAFLKGGAPDWSRIALSGHSLGGGEATYIAKQKAVARVVLFAAPADGVPGGPAPWLGQPGATTPPAFFALVHTNDPSYAQITAAWSALTIYGADMPVTVDGAPALFAAESALVTSMPPVPGGDAHDSVIVDAATPTLNGLPLYQTAWARLIGPN